MGYVWQRFRRWIKNKPSAEEYADKVARMKVFTRLATHGHIDIYFGDEAGFSLQPYIPYGWQPVGQQGKIASRRKNVQNVLGFLNPLNGHLATYSADKKQTINTDFMIKCLDDFASQLKRLAIVAIDHAPWHTSEKFRQRRQYWEEKGLFVFYLPRYSPHLNLIETLWRKIKYEWLRPQDYNSPTALKRRLKEIFTEFNNRFQIDFSMNIYT